VKRRNQGRLLVTRAAHALRTGQVEAAEALARRALEASPRDPEVLHALADLAWEHDEPAAAADLLGQAIASHQGPPPASWRLRLAEAFFRQGKVDDTVRAYQEAIAAAPDEVSGWVGLARALQTVHHVADAIEAWERVLALTPDDWQAWNDLGAALMERRDWDRAAAAFDAAAAGDDPMSLVNRATLDLRRGRPSEAVTALERCLERFPVFAPALAGLGFALREQGKLTEAAAALRRAAELAPGDSTFACGLARVLLEGGAAAEALAAAQDHLRRRPGYAGALAIEALACLAGGDQEGADRLLDRDRLVSRSQLPVPDGFSDLSSFNRALADHAATHRTLLLAPASHATSEGLHSGSLLISPRGPVAALEKALRAAVARYSKALPDLPGHPFVAARPGAAFFNIWCVVLRSGGHQIPHIHPDSWLSGVYYPQVPDAIRTSAGPDGWLEFGYADRSFPSRLDPRVVRVRPAEGLLVMFPSYFYHRTVPFEAEGTRISIAFDLVPFI
jgi:tetratricopeptide (TPR) repeat protein